MNGTQPTFPHGEDRSGAQNTLVEGLKEKAAAHRRVEQHAKQLDSAAARGALSLSYLWQTPDDQDAEMLVYFQMGSETEILGARLQRLEYRDPTIQERARLEEAFDDELQLMGDLWTDVASHVAERRNLDERPS
jgi:hypothetical protein